MRDYRWTAGATEVGDNVISLPIAGRRYAYTCPQPSEREVPAFNARLPPMTKTSETIPLGIPFVQNADASIRKPHVL